MFKYWLSIARYSSNTVESAESGKEKKEEKAGNDRSQLFPLRYAAGDGAYCGKNALV
jgi:hypothetical protein